MLGQYNPILGVTLGQYNPILGVTLGQYNPTPGVLLGQSYRILGVLLALYNPILGVVLVFIKPNIVFGRTFPFWGIPTKVTNITHKFTIFNPVWGLKKFPCESPTKGL